jgi:endonuclease/exonuclease/phosphatase family metal-dependent hydrolase
MKFSLFALLLLTACTSLPKKVATTSADHVSVMTYNVENLFDTEDDPLKEDETFLPGDVKESAYYKNKCRVQANTYGQARECLSNDWSDRILDRKLHRLSDVVSQVEDGYGPDILIVEEVESQAVLDLWRQKHMPQMGYQSLAYVKGPDVRGINPAIMSRLPMIDAPKLHEISFDTIETNARPSRGILEAHFRLPDGETLTVFAVHLPSQGAPTPFRRVALQTLMDEALRQPPDARILIGGDFNISAKEEYKEHLLAKDAAPHFLISHDVGCDKCAGTIYYPKDQTWSFFDILMFSKNFSDGKSPWQLSRESIHIVNTSLYQTNSFGTPARFGNGRASVGVSDHWPMYAELRFTPPPKTAMGGL